MAKGQAKANEAVHGDKGERAYETGDCRRLGSSAADRGGEAGACRRETSCRTHFRARDHALQGSAGPTCIERLCLQRQGGMAKFTRNRRGGSGSGAQAQRVLICSGLSAKALAGQAAPDCGNVQKDEEQHAFG